MWGSDLLAALPVRLFQQILVDFADRRLGETIDEFHQPRALQPGQGRYHPAVTAIGVPIVSADRKTVLGMNCGGASSVMTPEFLAGPVAALLKPGP